MHILQLNFTEVNLETDVPEKQTKVVSCFRKGTVDLFGFVAYQ